MSIEDPSSEELEKMKEALGAIGQLGSTILAPSMRLAVKHCKRIYPEGSEEEIICAASRLVAMVTVANALLVLGKTYKAGSKGLAREIEMAQEMGEKLAVQILKDEPEEDDEKDAGLLGKAIRPTPKRAPYAAPDDDDKSWLDNDSLNKMFN
jgi:hypothetical protein